MEKRASLIGLALALAAASAPALAEDGSGVGAAVPAATAGTVFPAPDAAVAVQTCAVDNYGAYWHLSASGGKITGTRDNLQDCVWGLSGAYRGPNFQIDLVLQSGSSCCTSGYIGGTVDKPSRTAAGQTYWTGNCSSGPWDYFLAVPCN